MFTKNKVTGVVGNTVKTDFYAPAAMAPKFTPKVETTANMPIGFPGSPPLGYPGSVPSTGAFPITPEAAGGPNVQLKGFWASNYSYYMTGLIPADPSLIDTSTLSLFYRDMYLFDSTAGSSVDILSTFSFSDFELRGVEKADLKIYDEALARLNITQMMPEISVAYLVDGFFCGSLVFDPRSKQFIDTLIHDALQCAVIPSPFYNIDPTINVRVGQATQQFLHDTSPYARRYLAQMPQQFRDMLLEGAFTLDPVSTLFIARRTLTDRAYLSYLHRILPMYLIEKTMFRGTLTEAQRRQRAMTHLTAGDDQWTPNTEELDALVSQFQMAENDPLGGWITTRNAVQAVDLRPGGDFWKWTDMADVLVAYKLRALGISESFLSGDASYAAAETAYSTFLESQNAYRNHLTNAVFYRKLFPLIAVINGMYKDPARKAKPGQVMDFLFNASDRDNLKMPKLHWHKKLEARGEENMMDMLDKASEKGIPIPLKMWMAASDIDSEALLRDLGEDADLRAKLAEFTGKDTSHEGEDLQADGDEDYGMGDFEGNEASKEMAAIKARMRHLANTNRRNDGELAGLARREKAMVAARTQTLTSQSMANGGRNRASLLGRDFGGGLTEYTEETKSGTGRRVVSNQVAARQSHHHALVKVATQMHRDPNYRASVAIRNKKVLGQSHLPNIGGLRLD